MEYGIEDLKKLCIDFFKSTLTVDTVCEALQAAISYNNSDLKKTCLGFVERNTLGVFKSRTFVEMSEESLSYILQSDKLKADESEVLNAVKEWCTVNAVSIPQIGAHRFLRIVGPFPSSPFSKSPVFFPCLTLPALAASQHFSSSILRQNLFHPFLFSR